MVLGKDTPRKGVVASNRPWSERYGHTRQEWSVVGLDKWAAHRVLHPTASQCVGGMPASCAALVRNSYSQDPASKPVLE